MLERDVIVRQQQGSLQLGVDHFFCTGDPGFTRFNIRCPIGNWVLPYARRNYGPQQEQSTQNIPIILGSSSMVRFKTARQPLDTPGNWHVSLSGINWHWLRWRGSRCHVFRVIRRIRHLHQITEMLLQRLSQRTLVQWMRAINNGPHCLSVKAILSPLTMLSIHCHAQILDTPSQACTGQRDAQAEIYDLSPLVVENQPLPEPHRLRLWPKHWDMVAMGPVLWLP